MAVKGIKKDAPIKDKSKKEKNGLDPLNHSLELILLVINAIGKDTIFCRAGHPFSAISLR
jgi:hypothetical protein